MCFLGSLHFPFLQLAFKPIWGTFFSFSRLSFEALQLLFTMLTENVNKFSLYFFTWIFHSFFSVSQAFWKFWRFSRARSTLRNSFNSSGFCSTWHLLTSKQKQNKKEFKKPRSTAENDVVFKIIISSTKR